MTWGILLNAIFMVLCWSWATDAFKEERNTMGWLNIFVSAWNAASIASAVL